MKKKAFGTSQIAVMCQVTPSTIWRWIKGGGLPSFTTLGGHHKVWDADLVAFFKTRNIAIPEEIDSIHLKKIVIVDDEDDLRRVVKRLAQKIYPEAQIDEAANGFEAGHRLALSIPMLVILDIQLPGLDGFKVCKIIRSDKRLKNTKILAISGQDPQKTEKQALKAGADDFLAKPFDLKALRIKIMELIGD